MRQKKSNLRAKTNLILSKSHSPYPHRLARTAKESKKNLDLLFALQRLTYPELNRAIKMRRDLIKWRQK